MSVIIKDDDGKVTRITLKNVRHVPELGQNLISEGSLLDSGLKVHKSTKEAIISDEKGNLVFKAERDSRPGGLFYLNGSISHGSANYAMNLTLMEAHRHFVRLAPRYCPLCRHGVIRQNLCQSAEFPQEIISSHLDLKCNLTI